MPHLVLEYSANILEKEQLHELFRSCHSLIATMLPTSINRCKSRAVESKLYYIADGNLENAFIHLSLQVKPGRSNEVLQKLGQSVLELLGNYFKESLACLNLQITLEITTLSEHYFLLP